MKNKTKELKKKFEKAQLKCVKESLIKGTDEFNPKHFEYCEADILDAKIKSKKESRKETIEEIEKIIDEIFKVNNWKCDLEVCVDCKQWREEVRKLKQQLKQLGEKQ